MPEWIWHWSGYAVALVSFVGVVWAIFWDRARGRKRCRRCWYDLSGVGDLPASCPECGRSHAKAKDLTRTRRRWGRAALLSLAMVVGGYGLWVVPRVQERGAWGLIPTTALIAAGPWLEHLNDQISGIQFDLAEWGETPTAAQRAEADRFHRFSKAEWEQNNRVLRKTPEGMAEELLVRAGSMGERTRVLAFTWWRWADAAGLSAESDSWRGTARVTDEVSRGWVRSRKLPGPLVDAGCIGIVRDLIESTPIERIGWKREGLVRRPPEGLHFNYGGFVRFEGRLGLPRGYVVEVHYMDPDGGWRHQLGRLPLRGAATRVAVVVRDESRFVGAFDVAYNEFRIAADAGYTYLPKADALSEEWTGTLPNGIELIESEIEMRSRVFEDPL